MRALAAAALLIASASTAHAAPWSFELPAGYTEVVAGADDKVMHLRTQDETVSADGQLYRSRDARVALTRITWQFRLDDKPTRADLVQVERVSVQSGVEAGKLLSESRQFVGDQLHAETLYEIEGGRSHQRRLYSADSDGVVHQFWLTCEGPADHLEPCERALESMQLTLPNQAPLVQHIDKVIVETDLTFVLALIAGGVVAVALVIWLLLRRKRR